MKNARVLGAIWGILGVSIILTIAILRVTPHVFNAINIGLSSLQWVVLVIWSAFMLVAEGYRGFQKNFSPRVVARAWYLINHGKKVDLTLAPFFCMGYFHATRKRIITSWSLTIGIVLLIVGVRFIAQPWRGIIDSGVVLGLLYGLVWVHIFTVRTLIGRSYLEDPEIMPLKTWV